MFQALEVFSILIVRQLKSLKVMLGKIRYNLQVPVDLLRAPEIKQRP